jgi:hypothetical protein
VLLRQLNHDTSQHLQLQHDSCSRANEHQIVVAATAAAANGT